jgi:hypothetical protein
MPLTQTLLEIDELHQYLDDNTFSQNIPVEWIESALTLSSQATIRRRRLPSDQVLWLVLGMALFRQEPIHEAARRLNICAQGLANESLLAKSGVTQARTRLGAAPIEWLYRKTAKHWGLERYPEDTWEDLQVFAIDGALLRTPDSPELRQHFGSGNTSTDRQTPYPMMRLVSLMNVRSHVMMVAQINPYRKGEIPQARKKNPTLPQTWQVRAVSYRVNGVDKTVYTSLPYEHYPTQKVAQLYHERWEIELGYRYIKSSMQHNALTLRSKKVELVEQEVWGLLLAYNLIRREASQAAISFGKSPNQISFKAVFQYIAVQLIVMTDAVSPSKTGARLSELRGGIASLIIENRPRPSRSRSVKMSKTRYPVNRNESVQNSVSS